MELYDKIYSLPQDLFSLDLNHSQSVFTQVVIYNITAAVELAYHSSNKELLSYLLIFRLTNSSNTTAAEIAIFLLLNIQNLKALLPRSKVN